MPTNKLNVTRRRLLRWYDDNRRSLPWRRTRDPYAIWIAETMLQQTRVRTVLRYYIRFLKAFPRLGTLAAAPKPKVMALWSGLGYYRRAENLLKAARLIVREHRGSFPRDHAALRSLPGVGPYTAGAMMSIAFDQPHPALDGNARRVLNRAFNARRDKDLLSIAQKLVRGPRPGHLNQALMEIGSRICRARDPSCPDCPLRRSCAARRSGLPGPSEARSGRPRAETIDWPMVLLQRDGKVLIRRRPEGGLLPGLWELPGGERKQSESHMSALRRHLDGIAMVRSALSQIGEIRHSITYRRIRAPIYRGTVRNQIRLPLGDWRWVSPTSLQRYPVSSLTLKAVKLLQRP